MYYKDSIVAKTVSIEIMFRFSLSFLKGEDVPNRDAIKAKVVSPEILFTPIYSK